MGSALDVERAGATLRNAVPALDLRLDDRQLSDLLAFLELLIRWNATYNLTAVRDPEQMVTHHLLDCLACIAPLRRETGGLDTVKLLDVGSGGGLPGAVIAIVDPRIRVACIDTVGKKAAFVAQVAASLRLPNLHAIHGRVENSSTETFDVITSRAFSSLTKFVQCTERLLLPSGKWMAMKGQRPRDELAKLNASIEVFHVEQLQVPALKAERCLVWMRPA